MPRFVEDLQKQMVQGNVLTWNLRRVELSDIALNGDAEMRMRSAHILYEFEVRKECYCLQCLSKPHLVPKNCGRSIVEHRHQPSQTFQLIIPHFDSCHLWWLR